MRLALLKIEYNCHCITIQAICFYQAVAMEESGEKKPEEKRGTRGPDEEITSKLKRITLGITVFCYT